MNNTLHGTVEMTAAMAILGTIGWFVVLSGQPAIDVVFWRCAFGAATLLVICAALGLLRGTLTPRVAGLAVLGGAAIVINWLLLFSAFPRASISIATAVYNTQPFMLVGFGALFLGERLTLAKLAWLAIAFAGMLLIVQTGPDAGDVGTDYFTGIVMALGAAFFWAVAAIVTKTLSCWRPSPIFPTSPPTPGAGLCWRRSASSTPVVAILVDVGAFGHRLHPAQILGAAAILIAAAGMTLGWTLWKPKVPSPQAAE